MSPHGGSQVHPFLLTSEFKYLASKYSLSWDQPDSLGQGHLYNVCTKLHDCGSVRSKAMVLFIVPAYIMSFMVFELDIPRGRILLYLREQHRCFVSQHALYSPLGSGHSSREQSRQISFKKIPSSGSLFRFLYIFSSSF